MRLAIDAAQKLILENEGTLTTLTMSIVCPSARRWIVCSAIVGDSNAYVYSPKQKSVYELTEGKLIVQFNLFRLSLFLLGSRDLQNERDMRLPGGAIGMTMDEQPDLSNLTYSIMEIDQGDFVFLTTDGVSDNYDPCVSGAAASIKTPLLARKSSHTTSETPPMLMTAYQRHQCTLYHMYLSITNRRQEEEEGEGEELKASDLCHRLMQHISRLTEEQRRTIEEGVQKNEGAEGSAKQQFEMEMRTKLGKIPGKLDHASLVVYKVR